MEKFAITISRQFASMGRSIAQELAQQMDIEFLDRDIVEETARRMNMSVSQISEEEEKIASRFAYRMYPLGIGVPSMKDEIFQVQKNIIQDYAKKDSCIVVGRCGSYCLKDHPKLLKVFIYAPYEERLKNCITKLHMQEKEAVKMITNVDAARQSYHKLYIPGYVNDAMESDLCINSAAFTIEEAATLIHEAAVKKLHL